jgi:hypothetical protein
MRLTFDILKKLNDIDFVLEICGDYTGTVTSVGAAGEYRPEELEHALETQEQFKTPIEKEKVHANDDNDDNADDIHRLANLNTILASEDTSQLGIPLKHTKNYVTSNSLKTIFCILFAAAGAASLVNLVVNGDIIMPNAGIFLSPPTSSILKQSSDYGTVNGEVTGQSSAMAASGGSVTVYKVGGLVDSVEKSAGYTKSSVISPDGHFLFKLPSGVYRIIVVYPNGKDQIIENYVMWPGLHTSLNLIYLQ